MKKKVVFYHVPKNAGTAIYNGYRNCPNFRRATEGLSDHVRISENPPAQDEVSFTVVRDPVDRFISIFYHLKNINDPRHGYHKSHNAHECEICSADENGHLDIHLFNDVNEFADALHFSDNPRHDKAIEIFRKPIFKSQTYWVGKDPKIILSQRNLKRDFNIIENITGCKMEWPEGVLANEGLTKKVHLNDRTIAIIKDLYKEDYLNFKNYF